MLLTLGEIGVEAVMVLATVAAIGCFVYLVALVALERRELRRLAAARRGTMETLLLRPRPERPVFEPKRVTLDAKRMAPPAGGAL